MEAADTNPGVYIVDVANVTATMTTDTAVSPPEVARAVRYLIDRELLTSSRSLPKTIAVVAAVGGEGVTTVSRSLAEVLAREMGHRVCWIDMGGAARAGAQVLIDRQAVEAAESPRRSEAVDDDPPLALAVSLTDVSSIRNPHNEQRYTTSGRPELEHLLERLSDEYDHLIFDTPPLLSHSAALGVLRHADAYVVVARHGSTSLNQLASLVEELRSLPSLGAIINRYQTRTPRFVRRFFAE